MWSQKGLTREPGGQVNRRGEAFFLDYTVQRRHSTRTHTHPYEHVRKPYPYEHLRRTEPANLEVHEVTTGASMSTGTSPTT